MSEKISKNIIAKDKFVTHKSEIDRLYSYYDFLGLTIEQYYKIVYSIIEKILKKLGNTSNFAMDLKIYINKYMYEFIKERLNNKSTFYSIIDSFINKKFEHTDTFEEAFQDTIKLVQFFEKLDIQLDPDKMIKIIDTNEYLKDALHCIYNKYKLEISKGQSFKVSEHTILNQMLEIYCMLENIEVDNNEVELFKSNLELPDSVKTYLIEIGNIPMLSEKEKDILLYKIAQGDQEAKNRFIQANLRLVVSVTKNYQGYGLPLLDLIQEGNLGLMTAVERFNPNYGYKFSTYAIYWIKEAIFRAIAQKSKMIRIPTYVHDKIISYSKAIRTFYSEYGREPSIEEIAEKMSMSIKEIEKLLMLKDNAISLESSLDDDNPLLTLESLLPSEEDLEERIIDASLVEVVEKLLNNAKLKSREQEVIRMRFGLNCERKTLVQIGEMYNVTKERVRQIEHNAILKLRACSEITELLDYVDHPDEAMIVIKKAKRLKFYH